MRLIALSLISGDNNGLFCSILAHDILISRSDRSASDVIRCIIEVDGSSGTSSSSSSKSGSEYSSIVSNIFPIEFVVCGTSGIVYLVLSVLSVSAKMFSLE